MAKRYGLSWMVTTDHGGPNHAKFNMTRAYAELEQSRESVPGVLQFYGMELNMPGMDHHTLIIPNAEDEWSVLFEIESRFDKNEAWPVDPERDTAAARVRTLNHVKALPRLPLLFANHPSRSARPASASTALTNPGSSEKAMRWPLPCIAEWKVHREHQAAALTVGDARGPYAEWSTGARGAYRNAGAHTLGGFDQMTALVGGVWDSMLGEGRRFWIVATSDSHVHYTEATRTGMDFWPGEFQKTYVHARNTYADVLDGLRSGRIFAVAGDLISELDVVADASSASAGIGQTLRVAANATVNVTIRFLDPDVPNASGNNPKVHRGDLILGDVGGPAADPNTDTNDTTRVVERFTAEVWSHDGELYSVETTLPAVDRDVYIRVRGTNTADAEPLMDEPGEDPWPDLWFYSNPIFIEVS